MQNIVIGELKFKDIIYNGYKNLRSLIILAFLAFVIGDLASTFLALRYGNNLMEGNFGTATLIGQYGLLGYAFSFVEKTIFLAILTLLAIFYVIKYKQMARFVLYGFIICGLYLTLSNLAVLFFNYPLIPPMIDQGLWANYSWFYMIMGLVTIGCLIDILNETKN
ncbi:MAG TPA: hypothetical protein VGK13_02910 [Methanocellaceae archaeon]|jgi:hypothetical protein